MVEQNPCMIAAELERTEELHSAIQRRDIRTVEFLLTEGVNIDAVVEGQVIHCCFSRRYQTSRVLFGPKTKIDEIAGSLGTRLHVAFPKDGNSRVVNVRLVELVLDRGADIDLAAGKVGTPRHVAVLESEINIAEVMLNGGADIDAAGSLGTALHIASTLK